MYYHFTEYESKPLDITQAWLIISKHINVNEIHVDAEESDNATAKILSEAVFILDKNINPPINHLLYSKE